MRLALLTLVFLLGGHDAAAQSPDADRSFLVLLKNSAWRVSCEKCAEKTGRSFSPYFMFLRDDMSVGYNFSSQSNYNFSTSPARWSLSAGVLVIEWKHGDVQKYSLAPASGDAFSGQNQHGIEQVIRRVGP